MKEEQTNQINAFDDIQQDLIDEEAQKNLTFTVEEESFGIPIEHVTQIIGIQHITFIPNQPKYVKGVINLRGQIIPVMDIRLKFGKPVIDYDDRTCIIVVNKNDMDVGIIVDRVSEVLNIKESEIAPTPSFNEEVKNQYISGIAHVNDNVIILLEIDELLDNDNH